MFSENATRYKRTRDIFLQVVLYVGAFYVTLLFSIANQVCFLIYRRLLFDLFLVALISLEDHKKILSATSRLRAGFLDTPIYARALNRAEAQLSKAAGTTDIVFEAD